MTDKAAVYFCEKCAEIAHEKPANRDGHVIQDVITYAVGVNELDLLSVICIETSHYVCFTRSEDRWVFFDSMANRVCKYQTLQLTGPGNKINLLVSI